MSGSNQARDALHKVARDLYGSVHAAGSAYVKAHQATVTATDLVETMQHTVGLILAAEQLKERAEEAEKSARAALVEQMSETGATTIQTAGQTAYISRKAAWVSIDQEDMVPPDYMKQPPPTVDKKAIKAAIEAGGEVPGCTLIRPNDYSLVIRARKE